jgi:hypothetical protein
MKGVTKWLAGYRTDDFAGLLFRNKLNSLRPHQLRSLYIFPHQKHKEGRRKLMGSTLAWFYNGACNIKPDDNDLASQIDGAKHRVGSITPPVNKKTLRQFKTFVSDWLHKNLTPLSPESDVSVETWLKESPYTEARKEELLTKLHDFKELMRDHQIDKAKLESFIKEEFYGEPKAFRTINSRLDEYKCLVGPIIHAIEQQVFKNNRFIKKVPVSERAALINECMAKLGYVGFEIDFQSFEGSFCRAFMEACEVQLFEYMSKMLPMAKEFMVLYRQLLLSNKLCFSGFVCVILAKRMSGEMSTSVANGFSNMMLIEFTAFKQGIIVIFFVEGDDSIGVSSAPLSTKWFTKLGFIAKIIRHNDVRTASFCGLIFTSEESLVKDPIKTILQLGWCSRQYNLANDKTRGQLTRAKALSLKCEMPDCPILGPLADKLIELTCNYSMKKSIQKLLPSLSSYERGEYLNLVNNNAKWSVKSNVTTASRLLVAEMFNISVDAQLIIESEIQEMSLGPFNSPTLDTLLHSDKFHYWNTFVVDSPEDTVVLYPGRIDFYATHLCVSTFWDNRFKKQSYSKGMG